MDDDLAYVGVSCCQNGIPQQYSVFQTGITDKTLRNADLITMTKNYSPTRDQISAASYSTQSKYMIIIGLGFYPLLG